MCAPVPPPPLSSHSPLHPFLILLRSPAYHKTRTLTPSSSSSLGHARNSLSPSSLLPPLFFQDASQGGKEGEEEEEEKESAVEEWRRGGEKTSRRRRKAKKKRISGSFPLRTTD